MSAESTGRIDQNSTRHLQDAGIRSDQSTLRALDDVARPLQPAPIPAPTIDGFVDGVQVARGAFGAVYRYRQVGTQRDVAIKLLLSAREMDERDAWRFEDEIRSLGALDHPNVVNVFQTGLTSDERRYVAMEYVDGQCLDDYVRSRRLALRDVLRLFRDICDGLQHAHTRGLIHRDIKPGNILVRRDGVAKIVDFGLAKLRPAAEIAALQSPISAGARELTVGLAGTPAYMSPEQAEGRTVDARSDVYSLGVTLYTILTGEMPYRISAASWREEIGRVPPTLPARAWRSDRGVARRHAAPPANPIDRDVEALLLKALEKSPEARYQSAVDLGREIERYLEGRPIDARRSDRLYVWRKQAWRFRVPLGIAAAFVMTLVASSVVLRAAERRATDNESRAKNALAQESAARQAERAARDDERRATAQVAVAAARSAARVGDWATSIEQYHRALEIGVGDEIAVRLGLIEALSSDNRSTDAREELKQLQSLPALRTHPQRGAVKLWEADAGLFDISEADSRDLIAEAIDEGLSPADTFYAQALIAPTIPRAAELLEQAIAADPFHYRATMLVSLPWMLLGDMHQARAQATLASLTFPNSPDNLLSLMVLAMFGGDENELHRAAAEARQKHPMAKGIFDLVEQTGIEMIRVGRDQSSGVEAVLGLMARAIRFASDAPASAPADSGILNRTFRLPFAGSALLSAVSAGAWAQGFGNPEASLTAFRQAGEIWPDASMYLVQAKLLNTLGRNEEAIQPLEAALTARCLPPLEPAVRAQARAELLSSLGPLVVRDSAPLAGALPAHVDRLRSLLDEFVAAPTSLTLTYEWDTVVMVALSLAELDRAEKLVRAWRWATPQPNPPCDLRDMQLRYLRGDHAMALRAARAILANDPADNDARFIAADALQRLNTTDPRFEPPILKRYDETRDTWLNSPAGRQPLSGVPQK